MSTLIPVLSETVSSELKDLLSEKLVSIIFDGGVYDNLILHCVLL
jgi:hypothetical protein